VHCHKSANLEKVFGESSGKTIYLLLVYFIRSGNVFVLFGYIFGKKPNVFSRKKSRNEVLIA
jgi:hypothetical protein